MAVQVLGWRSSRSIGRWSCWASGLMGCLLCLTPSLFAQDEGEKAAPASAAAVTLPTSEHFMAPRMVMLGDEPLNSSTNQMYPSPAIYDIDGDGKPNLVVGDIRGRLFYYANQNQSGTGEPVWTAPIQLTQHDGEAVSVPNW